VDGRFSAWVVNSVLDRLQQRLHLDRHNIPASLTLKEGPVA
jgi:hypothetical protein